MFFERLKSLGRNLKQEIRVYKLVLGDCRTPWLAKFLLGLAVGYVLMPFDIIPDFIPVIGHIDDAVIVPLLVFLALKLIPEGIIEECRDKVKGELLAGSAEMP
jgi:uncharacterized membrane protein YkvA (DUF1232 family)